MPDVESEAPQYVPQALSRPLVSDRSIGMPRFCFHVQLTVWHVVAGKDTSTCVKLLQQAAATRAVAPKEVFAAIRKLEKEKLSVS